MRVSKDELSRVTVSHIRIAEGTEAVVFAHFDSWIGIRGA